MFPRTYCEDIEKVFPEAFTFTLSELNLLEKVQEEILADIEIQGIPEDEPAEWSLENEPLSEWFLASLNLLSSDKERVLFTTTCLRNAKELRKAEGNWLSSADFQVDLTINAREDLQSWGEDQADQREAAMEDYHDGLKEDRKLGL